MNVCVSDWVGFNCGDPVHRLDDPRHTGVVRAVLLGGFTIRVTWDDSRWISDEDRTDLYNMRTGRPR